MMKMCASYSTSIGVEAVPNNMPITSGQIIIGQEDLHLSEFKHHAPRKAGKTV